LVPQVLSDWSKKVTAEGGIGGLRKQMAQRQAGGEMDVPAAFRYQSSEGYSEGASAGIARALGLTSVGAPPPAPRGSVPVDVAAQGVSGEQRMAVGGAAGAMQTMIAASGGDFQVLQGVRAMLNKAQFGDKPRVPLGEQIRDLKAQETFAETYGQAYGITGQREAALQLAQKRHGVQGAGSLPAAMSMLEKSRDVGAYQELMPELTQESVSTLEGLNDALGKWTETVGTAVEGGKELDKTQVRYTKILEKGLADVPRMRMLAESADPKSPFRERALALTGQLQGAGAALGPAQAAIAGQQWKELQGEVGGKADASRMFRKLTGGFEMMRMQRLWGMTGGMATGAMQPAAQEQMLALQAAGMGMPAGQFQMGSLAEGILGTRARQQQFQLSMGRAAGRAYGSAQGMMAQPAVGEVAGIALPAVGAGLLAGQVAGMAGLAAGPIGLAIGAGVGALGLGTHLASSTGSDRASAMARMGRGELSLDLLASGTGRKSLLAGTIGMLATPADALVKAAGFQRAPLGEQLATQFASEADRDVMERAMTIRSGELSGQSLEDRAQTIQYAYKEAAPQWMEQTAAEQMAAQWMQYTPEDTNIQDIYGSRQFEQMAARGESVEQFAKMAGQWGGAPDQWQQYQELYAGIAPSAVPGMEYTAAKWEPMRRGYGMEGIDILGAAAAPFADTSERETTLGEMADLGKSFGMLKNNIFGLGDAFETLTEHVEDAPIQAERLTTLQTTQLQQAAGTAERARMMGLEVAAPPEQLTGAWAEGQFREQMPLLQGRMALQQQVMGMGLGMGGGAALAEQFQTPGQMQMFQRFLGGDQRVMSMLGQGAVQGPFQPNVPLGYGMQVNTGAMRGQFLGAVQSGMEGAGYGQPQITESMQQLTKAFDDLRPVIETDTGLRMGTTRMWEGWGTDVTGGASTAGGPTRVQKREAFLSGQGMQLPEIGGGYGAVDEHMFQRFADIMQDTGVRGVQAEQQTLQNQYQEFQMGQRERGLEWSRVSQLGGTFEEPGVGEITTRGSLAITKELRSLGRMWEDFTSTYNERSREVAKSQFMENWDVRAERMPTQFGWQREDLAFQGAQTSLQFGWQMEDLQEAGRFATGRDRRKIQKQQERAAISYSMSMGRLDTQGERLDTREQWAGEDLERQKRHFLERNALQDDYQSRYKSHMESRRQLEDEMHAIREFGAQFQIKQAEDQLAKQKEMNEQMKAINATMTAYSQSLENANAQMSQVVQMVQFLFSNLAVGGEGQFNLPNAAAGFFQGVQAGFSSAAQSVQLPYSDSRR